MCVVHEDTTNDEDECSAGDDDERVGKELRTRVVMKIVPRPFERREDIDKQQREQEHHDQVEDDTVSSGVVVWYGLI